MTAQELTSDAFWESKIYASGKHLNLYPYDSVVSFVFRSYPREKPRHEIRILEIGCGAGNNLWFVAREGFQAIGIAISPTAISFAKQRFEEDKLDVDLRVGSFLELPWADKSMDICIDRCSTACVGFSDQLRAIQDVSRVLKPGGLFFFNGYSDHHTSYQHGQRLKDGKTANIEKGTLQGVGGIGFLAEKDIYALFESGWEIKALEHVQVSNCLSASVEVHSEWRVVSQRL